MDRVLMPVPNDVSTVADLIQFRAQKQPETVGYRFLPDGEAQPVEITYAALDRDARAIAAQLQARVTPGSRALLQIPSNQYFISAFAGCLYAGVIPVPAPVPRRHRPADGLAAIAQDCEPGIVLTTTGVAASMNPDNATVSILRGHEWLAVDNPDILDPGRASSTSWRKPAIAPDHIALLQYTSGSTSAPKGVMVSHANLMHNQRMIRDACGYSERTVIVAWLPFFHDMGLIGNVLQPLYLGVTGTFLNPASVLQKPLRWLQAISHYRGTTSGGPNFIYDLCAAKIKPEQADTLDLSSWEVAFNGAEPVRRDTLERFTRHFAKSGFRARAFHPCYGLAEATLRVCGPSAHSDPICLDVDAGALERHRVMPAQGTAKSRHLVGCGSASEFHQVRLAIVDPAARQEVSAGRVGEIWIKGPNVAQGYWNKKTETLKTFHARLDSGEGPFLRTGDLGFIHSGELFVSGRLKDMMIVCGRNIYPQDIELIVQRCHPAFEGAPGAAFSLDIGGVPNLIVTQEVRSSHRRALDPDEARAAIRKAVAQNFDLGVQAVVLLGPGGVPRTTSGKIRRNACRDSYLRGIWPAEKIDTSKRARPFSADDVAPQAQLQEQI